jgi:hypothetical protein
VCVRARVRSRYYTVVNTKFSTAVLNLVFRIRGCTHGCTRVCTHTSGVHSSTTKVYTAVLEGVRGGTAVCTPVLEGVPVPGYTKLVLVLNLVCILNI